jgi:hypothetical protein
LYAIISLVSGTPDENLKTEIYRTIILPVVLYRCETWSLALMEEYASRLRILRTGA